jgi:16S rRNA (cytosine1402-N4)-methyltransferase
MTDKKPERVRRERYKGTHPKTFKEKYKELQPENYANDIAKVIEQGRTPAGMHRSICVDEILDFLQIEPGQVGVDATLGYGGHCLEMLKKLAPNGKLFGLDVDPIELPKTKARLETLGYGEEIFVAKKMNFSSIDLIVYESGLLNFVLADLGVSSMQIDNPERGFSYKLDGPLDLRLNPKNGKPVSALLKTISLENLERILTDNSDEPYAKEISFAIVSKIKTGVDISTTKQLQEIIAEALHFLPKETKAEELKKTNARCFQALRIEVNDEFTVLDKFLEKLPKVLAKGGKVIILSFHSGEDRRVKKSFQHYFRQGIYSKIAQEAIRPTAEECNTNSRARSTKMRWAIKG